MSRGCPGNDRFLKIFFFFIYRKILTYLSQFIQFSDGYKEKVSCLQMIQIRKRRRRICSNLADFVQI